MSFDFHISVARSFDFRIGKWALFNSNSVMSSSAIFLLSFMCAFDKRFIRKALSFLELPYHCFAKKQEICSLHDWEDALGKFFFHYELPTKWRKTRFILEENMFFTIKAHLTAYLKSSFFNF